MTPKSYRMRAELYSMVVIPAPLASLELDELVSTAIQGTLHQLLQLHTADKVDYKQTEEVDISAYCCYNLGHRMIHIFVQNHIHIKMIA